MVKLNLNYLQNVDIKKVDSLYEKKMDNLLKNFTNRKHPMMGWIDFPNTTYLKEEYPLLKQIKTAWRKLKIDTVVVIGIGGSYNGVKAAIDYLDTKNNITYLYLSELSSLTLMQYEKMLAKKNWGIVVISKSGTTLETSVNFKIAREWLNKKYKQAHNQRIVAITDPQDGVLNQIATKHKYYKLSINKNIGGRYSALTSVSLFLMEYKDIKIDAVLKGYQNVIRYFLTHPYENNVILQYVAFRDYLYKTLNKNIEVFQVYDESLRYIAETYKQLFAESEGKKSKTLFPVISVLSNDLHSIGQLYQEGTRDFFQTTCYVKETIDYQLPTSSFKNDDNLNYLDKKSINQIKDKLLDSVLKAHTKDAKNHNLYLEFSGDRNEVFGEIYAFLCCAASASSYLNGVDPFNQPGVEIYKQNLKKALK